MTSGRDQCLDFGKNGHSFRGQSGLSVGRGRGNDSILLGGWRGRIAITIVVVIVGGHAAVVGVAAAGDGVVVDIATVIAVIGIVGVGVVIVIVIADVGVDNDCRYCSLRPTRLTKGTHGGLAEGRTVMQAAGAGVVVPSHAWCLVSVVGRGRGGRRDRGRSSGRDRGRERGRGRGRGTVGRCGQRRR